MYYYYRKIDPVLQKLQSNTISALYDGGIVCIEDLFGMDEEQILDLYGIGKKRAGEIQEFLNSLPFDYMDPSLPTNPEKNPNLGMHPSLIEHIRNLHQLAYQGFVKRGVEYYTQNRVQLITLKDEINEVYQAEVQGSRLYTVEFSLKKNNRDRDKCSCPAYKNWLYGSTYCKHMVAAILKLAEQQRLARYLSEEDGNHSFVQLKRTLKSVYKEARLQTQQQLSYLLERSAGQWDLYPQAIYGLIKSSNKTQSRGYYSYSYKNPWDQVKPLTSKDRLIFSQLRKIYDENLNSFSNIGSGNGTNVGDILEFLVGENLKLKNDKTGPETVYVNPEPFRFHLEVKPQKDENKETNSAVELQFRIEKPGLVLPLNAVEIVSPDPFWVYYDGNISKVEAGEIARRFIINSSRKQISIPNDQLESFLVDLFPIFMEADIPVNIEDEITSMKKIDPEPRVYLSEQARELRVEFRIAYGSYELKGMSGQETLYVPAESGDNENGVSTPIWLVNRDIDSEQKWLDKLAGSALTSNGQPFTFTPVMDSLGWVIDHLPRLSEAGFKIFGEKDLKRFARPKKMTSSSFRITSGEQWFELEGEMKFGDISININDIRKVLIKNKPYVQLHDNSTGELPANWLNQLKRLLHLTDPGKEKVRIPKIAANLLDDLAKTADAYEADTDFREYANRLRSFEQIEETEPPKSFNGDLRSYQQAGLSWMQFLNRYGFGGILADDMGLGKTIQVLALLQKVAEAENKKPQSLVIVPRSVLHNWQAEAQKFVPDFEVYIHHGTDRTTNPDNWPEADLCITTYSTMRNDIYELKKKQFDYAILDESHTVRNPASKTFKALKLINARNRLCMSGTPVQNTTMDLWTQFQYLNPGLLGSQKQFKEKWVKPVEEKNDKTAEEMLHKMVSPFILRRTKQQVATDLPPLTSTLIECPMDRAQEVIYEKYRQVYYQMINKSLDTKGLRESRFAVLEGLTRLRQICCSPRLIAGEKGNSAKLTRFAELAEELISEGHRALVFSQFVGFLKLLEKEVQDRGWKYEYLDGQTRDRQKRVDRFQSDSTKDLFLISLKAGGEGLNLTAADYVFIMDPWWNPAAERQAMDRTHRIGQKNNVFVYRFVSPGTVEEKILRLQERKKGLAEKLIVAESGIFKELNRDDLLGLFE